MVDATQLRGGSALDGRTTRHLGYQLGQRRVLVGRVFACVKWVTGLKRVNLRGLAKLSGLVKFAAAARNIWRRPNCRRSVVGLA